MPALVVLSMCIGVAGCRCPSSVRMSCMIFASCAFRNRAPNSASAADAATSFRMVHVMWMAPFRRIGSPLRGRLPRKKYPPARLHTLGAERYEASECTFRIMSEAQYRMIASGCVHM